MIQESIRTRKALQVIFLAIGQGDSTLFRFPNGYIAIVDGGPSEEGLIRQLRRKNISKVDLMVLSHPDLDHALGLLYVLEQMPVQELWHTGFSLDHPMIQRITNLARRQGTRIRMLPEIFGVHPIGDAAIEVLAPQKLNPNWSTNNNSIVMKISWGQNSVLMPGDLEAAVEQQANAQWHAQVLKVPHHGSRSSSSEHLVRQVRPSEVVFCTQPGNQFGFPHAEVVLRWKNSGARVWDTGVNGEVRVWMSQHEMELRSYR
ncbi:MAG: MBL fold metallo-hydrolase [Myxococcaceae bacterium]|nr:MBL fold metallo-hydrolase [Myxococcaceae bacterium]MBH2005736.1 MBL fold metallo-hydrolase [Myxococcaceae bacterium]